MYRLYKKRKQTHQFLQHRLSLFKPVNFADLCTSSEMAQCGFHQILGLDGRGNVCLLLRMIKQLNYQLSVCSDSSGSDADNANLVIAKLSGPSSSTFLLLHWKFFCSYCASGIQICQQIHEPYVTDLFHRCFTKCSWWLILLFLACHFFDKHFKLHGCDWWDYQAAN